MTLPLADSVWTTAVTIVPSVLWVFLVAAVVFAYRKEIRRLLPRLESIKIGPFEASLAKAGEARSKPVSAASSARLARRAERNEAALRGGRILWVDDNPDRNAREIETLDKLEVEVVTATSTDAALRRLSAERFDAVLSDIKRTGGDSGLVTEQKVRERYAWLPFVFYVGIVKPGTPGRAHGITDRPDELVDYVIDALERTRG